MITRRTFFFVSVVGCAGATAVSSCALEDTGAVDPGQVSELTSGSSSSSSSGSGSSSSGGGSSSATSSSGNTAGGAGGMGVGGSGASGGAGGTGGSGGGCNPACPTDMTCQGGKCLLCVPNSTQACYTGPPNTEGVGICAPGTSTCAADGMSWEKCLGETIPAKESCKNGLDDDCNGGVDSGPGCLVNTDLVVRYFLDEAAMGQGMTALDSAPSPVDLAVTYNGTQPFYSVNGTNRGLEWVNWFSGGVAKAAANGTKVRTMLDGKTKVTMEIVVRVDASALYSRFFGITSGTTEVFTLLALSGGPSYSLYQGGSEIGHWDATFGNAAPSVLHVVYDTTDATAANRVRFYLNGVAQNSTAGNPPAQNTALAIGGNDWLCVGNRDGADRSLDGVIYYAAIYANALSATDVMINSTILMANDDK